MPSIRDVSVHVLDSGGIKHEEWGLQRFRTSNDQTKVSAYIKSESGNAFSIAVGAKIPYRDYNTDEVVPSSSEDPNNIRKRQGMRVSDSRRRRSDNWEGPTSRHDDHNGSHDDFPIHTSSENYRSHKHRSSPIRTRSPPPPPFDLLATLYLDGRETPERRTIIYLDPAYEDFSPGPEGQGASGKIKSRWVTGKDGNIYEQAWVFKDVGIEAILDKMVLMANDSSPEKDEDDLVDAFNRTGMCLDEDLKREESKKIGQIEVTIMRVTIGRKKIDRNYRPKHQEGEDDDVDMERIDSDLCHTTAFSKMGALNSTRIPVISYTAYQNNERPFAIFKFFYRSQATLEKFKFPGFQMRENRVARKRDHMDSVMNHMTPLGISSGRVSTSKSKRYEGKSFEEQIKKGRSKKELLPKFNFDGQNRRLPHAKAEQSSQSDTNLPSHGNHRRSGVNSTKSGPCDEKENGIISPDHSSVIAADGSTTSSIGSVEHGGKIVVNDDPTLDAKDPSSGSADGLSSRDPNQRTLPATEKILSAQQLVEIQLNLGQKSAVLSSYSAGKNTSRGDTSSDADDEKDPTSDLDTCASESDMEFDDEDEGPSQNKDDDGLGEQLHETLKLSNTNGKRIRDAGGELDEGESREATRRCNPEEGQSQPEEYALDKMGEDGARSLGNQAVVGERTGSQGKRIKMVADLP